MNCLLNTHTHASCVKTLKSKGKYQKRKKSCLHLSFIHKSVKKKYCLLLCSALNAVRWQHTDTHVKCKNQLQSQPTKRVAARNLPGHFCGCHRQPVSVAAAATAASAASAASTQSVRATYAAVDPESQPQSCCT